LGYVVRIRDTHAKQSDNMQADSPGDHGAKSEEKAVSEDVDKWCRAA
jgi:hypothetical protein